MLFSLLLNRFGTYFGSSRAYVWTIVRDALMSLVNFAVAPFEWGQALAVMLTFSTIIWRRKNIFANSSQGEDFDFVWSLLWENKGRGLCWRKFLTFQILVVKVTPNIDDFAIRFVAPDLLDGSCVDLDAWECIGMVRELDAIIAHSELRATSFLPPTASMAEHHPLWCWKSRRCYGVLPWQFEEDEDDDDSWVNALWYSSSQKIKPELEYSSELPWPG